MGKNTEGSSHDLDTYRPLVSGRGKHFSKKKKKKGPEQFLLLFCFSFSARWMSFEWQAGATVQRKLLWTRKRTGTLRASVCVSGGEGDKLRNFMRDWRTGQSSACHQGVPRSDLINVCQSKLWLRFYHTVVVGGEYWTVLDRHFLFATSVSLAYNVGTRCAVVVYTPTLPWRHRLRCARGRCIDTEGHGVKVTGLIKCYELKQLLPWFVIVTGYARVTRLSNHPCNMSPWSPGQISRLQPTGYSGIRGGGRGAFWNDSQESRAFYTWHFLTGFCFPSKAVRFLTSRKTLAPPAPLLRVKICEVITWALSCY